MTFRAGPSTGAVLKTRVVQSMATNDVERLRDRLRERFPDAMLTLDKAETETGGWFLDVSLQGYDLVIEWRQDRGFGLSTPTDDDFGQGPDEVYEGVDAAYARAKALLLSQTPTRGPVLVRLREVPSDMLIGTLRNAIEAVGGKLYVTAWFPDETVSIDLQSIQAPKSAAEPESSAA
jgi:hypothetical protein